MFRKIRQNLLIVAMIVGGTFLSVAQETQKLSLDKSIKMALQNNTNILNSKLDLKAAQNRIWEITAMGLPHIDVKSTYQHLFVVPVLNFPGTKLSKTNVPYDANTGTGTVSQIQLNSGENIYLNMTAGDPIPLGVKNNISTDITVSQLIFSGSYIVGLQARKAYSELARQNDEKTKQEVIETVVNAYHMLQLAEESRKVLAQNLENMTKTLSEVTEMNKQGFVEKTDVDQLEVTANTIRNAINQIDSNLDLGYRLLKIQLGLEETVKIELSDPMESNESLINSSMLLINEKFNMDQNTDYLLVKTSEQFTKLDMKVSQSGFLPTISGFYNHNIQSNVASFNFAPKDLIGISLNLPIFSSGERLAVVAQKRVAYEKAQNTSKLISKSLTMQASQYQNDVKLKLEKYLNQKKSNELSDTIYQRTIEKYKQGMSSSIDLMNIQNQYLSNLSSYYQCVYDLQESKSKLEKLFNFNPETAKK